MAQVFDEEGKSTDNNDNNNNDPSLEVDDLSSLKSDEEVYIISQYDGYHLYESQNEHGYKGKGIQAFRACTNAKCNEWQEKGKWRLINKGNHYLIQSTYRDAYLYDSEVYTKESFKGIKYSFIACHNLAYRWKTNKAKWIIHKSEKD